MQAAGVARALAFVTSAFGSYSGCRQYREDIERARAAIGEGSPVVDKIRVFFNHPGFIEAMIDRVNDALGTFSAAERPAVKLLYTRTACRCGWPRAAITPRSFERLRG